MLDGGRRSGVDLREDVVWCDPVEIVHPERRAELADNGIELDLRRDGPHIAQVCSRVERQPDDWLKAAALFHGLLNLPSIEDTRTREALAVCELYRAFHRRQQDIRCGDADDGWLPAAVLRPDIPLPAMAAWLEAHVA